MTNRTRAGLIALPMSAAILLGLLWGRPAILCEKAAPPRLTLRPAIIVADGYDIATLSIETSSARPRISILKNPHSATAGELIETRGGWKAEIRAGVQPGHMLVRVEVDGAPAASAELVSRLDPRDSAGDGTPDVLRLDDAQDRQAFRRWFTFLAEAQYYQRPEARPAEINDCAALIRYAYREALRAHDERWAADAQLPVMPGFESAAKYQYPYTPLGAALFRIRPGPFLTADLAGGAFAQFADVQTLQRFNTHMVARDLGRALPGDLLFFRQDSDRLPFHSMIYVGESRIARDGGRYLVYHTGPDAAGPGEIRRPTVEQLLQFPDPRWRPIAGNPSFLGVYRWNILRTTS